MAEKIMTKEFRDLWVEALESGRYRKGRGFLRKERGDETLHCCLGVAVEIAELNGVKLSRSSNRYCLDPDCMNTDCQTDGLIPNPDGWDPEADGYVVVGWDEEYRFLPAAVSEWAGITERLATNLALVNDRPGDDSYTDVVEYLLKLPVADAPEAGLVSS